MSGAKLLIKYKNDNCVVQQNGDWIDLRAAEDVRYKAGELVTINLGVCIQLPAGYEAHLLPRSSTYKRYGLLMVNSMGIIDEAYCGNNDWWKMQMLPTKNGFFKAGSRIAQFRIMKKQEQLEIVQVESMNNPDRGGIGSTGV